MIGAILRLYFQLIAPWDMFMSNCKSVISNTSYGLCSLGTSCDIALRWMPQYPLYGLINIDWCNGLLPLRNKPLHDQMLTQTHMAPIGYN